jgi:hypothetical protein
MTRANHGGYKIVSFTDGSLYRARAFRADGNPIQVDGKSVKSWETAQCTDPTTAIGQAVYAIDCGKLK